MKNKIKPYQLVIMGLFLIGFTLNLPLCDCENTQPIAVLKVSTSQPLVGETVTLDGSHSYDLEGAPIAWYAWDLAAQPSASNAALSSASGSIVTITPDVEGRYDIVMTVSDGEKTSDKEAALIASLTSPVANAGPDVWADVGDTVLLDGSASYDPQGRDFTFLWQYIQGEPSGTITSSVSDTTIKFLILEPDTHIIRLNIIVSSAGGTIYKADKVLVITNPPDIFGFYPDSGSVGTAVAIDGKNFSSRLPDGNSVRFNGALAAITNASDSQLVTEVPAVATTGPISVKITETGDSTVSINDFVVIDAPEDPVANAGTDQMVDVGTTVTLDGSASTPLSQLSYSWSFLSRPAFSNAFINNNTNAMADFVMDEPGMYEVELEVTHSVTSQSDADTIVVTANPPEITSFSPTSGPAGTAVDIYGKNFSSSLSPAGNQVTFHISYLATITSASHNHLIAEVPPPAVTGPITVRIVETNDTTQSAHNFIVTTPGSPWTQVAMVGQNLHGVTFADNFNGIAVGNLGTAYRTTDGGFTWSPLNTGTSEPLQDVAFANVDMGYAVGEDGTILKTTDFGSSWNLISGVTTRDLYGVATPDDSTVYVAGQAGTVMRSLDQGTTWQAVNPGGQINYDIWLTNKDIGFVVNLQGQVRSTFNGGQSWATAYNRPSGEFFQAISFADSLNGTAVGTPGVGEIVKTVDGGVNWSPQNSGIQEILRGVSFVLGNPQIGIAVGDNGTVIRTTDGGSNWMSEISGVSEDLNDVFVIDANVAIMIGSFGTIFRRE